MALSKSDVVLLARRSAAKKKIGFHPGVLSEQQCGGSTDQHISVLANFIAAASHAKSA